MKRLIGTTTSVLVCLAPLGSWLSAAAQQTWPNAAGSEAFTRGVERPWIGAYYWANPMMDWGLKDGRVECRVSGVNHDLHSLACRLKSDGGALRMVSRMGLAADATGEGYIGFKFAVTGHDPADYRACLFDSQGVRAGVMADGRLLLGSALSETAVPPEARRDMTLVLEVDCKGDAAACTLSVFAGGATDANPAATFKREVRKKDLRGNVALACEQLDKKSKADVTGWFSSWTIEGSKVDVEPGRFFGPVLWTQYTLSRGTLRLLAHLAPLSASGKHPVVLRAKRDGGWKDIATAEMDPLSRMALFTIGNWEAGADVPCSVSYAGSDPCGANPPWEGTIRREPTDEEEISLAVFTGLAGWAFPNSDLAATVRKHDPGVMFFSGDQIYEGNGGYSTVRCTGRDDLERATLNYLPKFWIWGWTFRELLRDRPSVLTTDDHDVYSNDLWGRGGNARSSPTAGLRSSASRRWTPPASARTAT